MNVTFNSKPAEDGAWKSRIEAISTNAYSQLRYERWVKERRKTVDELSGGRIGYLHIQAMNPPSLRRFEKELREYRNKEAMVIDQRWNGGGNIEQELLAILVQRQYQVWQPRGTEATTRPFAGSSDRRSFCKTGAQLRTQKCFRRGSVHLVWGKWLALRQWEQSSARAESRGRRICSCSSLRQLVRMKTKQVRVVELFPVPVQPLLFQGSRVGYQPGNRGT